MLQGKAFLVRHPRRKEQDFVSCSIDEVCKALESNIYLKWPFRVTLITYRGDEAMSVLTNIVDLANKLHPSAKTFVTWDLKELRSV